MDVRDFSFWFRQGQVKMVQDQIKRIQAARLAMAENGQYERILSDFEMQLQDLEHDRETTVQDNWEFLRAMGRG